MLLEIDICHEIKQELKVQRRSVRWLAAQIGRDHSSLNRKLQYRSMDSDLLINISNILDVIFLLILHDALEEEREKRGKSSNAENCKSCGNICHTAW